MIPTLFNHLFRKYTFIYDPKELTMNYISTSRTCLLKLIFPSSFRSFVPKTSLAYLLKSPITPTNYSRYISKVTHGCKKSKFETSMKILGVSGIILGGFIGKSLVLSTKTNRSLSRFNSRYVTKN